MRKMLLLIAVLLGFQLSYAVVPSTVIKTDHKVVLSVTERARLEKFSKMTVKEYELSTGKKMNTFQKIAFKSAQRKAVKQLKAAYGDSETEGFNLGGFLLGLILGGIGVLGAYIFSKDRNFRKWAWLGWGTWVALYLISILFVH